MAKKADDGNTPQHPVSADDTATESAKLTIDQVAALAKPIFAEADKAQGSLDKINTRWRDYAQDHVATNFPSIYLKENAKENAKLRFAFYGAYISERGTFMPKPAERLASFHHYSMLNNEGKQQWKDGAAIKECINRAKVYYSRVMQYTKLAVEGEPDSRAVKDIVTLFRDVCHTLVKRGTKMKDKVALGKTTSVEVKSLIELAEKLGATTRSFAD